MPTEYHDMNAILQAKKDGTLKETPIKDLSVTEEVKTVESEPTPEPVVETEQAEEEVSEEAALANEEDTESEPADSEPAKEHRSKAAEKRIAKLVREREQLKGQLALFQQSQQQSTSQPQQVYVEADPLLPDPNQYPNTEDGKMDYKLDLREYQRNQERKDKEFKANLQKAIEKYPDLPELIEEDRSRTNATMVQLIKDSDVSVDLFHYLMANPDVSNKIAVLSPAQSAREIGKIEAKLEEKAKVIEKPPAAKKALPAPINPVKTNKAAAPVKQTRYTVY